MAAKPSDQKHYLELLCVPFCLPSQAKLVTFNKTERSKSYPIKKLKGEKLINDGLYSNFYMVHIHTIYRRGLAGYKHNNVHHALHHYVPKHCIEAILDCNKFSTLIITERKRGGGTINIKKQNCAAAHRNLLGIKVMILMTVTSKV